MGFIDSYKTLAYKVFNPYVETLLPYFESIKPDMQKADIKLSLREYVAVSIFTTAIMFPVEMIVLSFFLSFVSGFSLFFVTIFSFTLSVAMTLGLLFYFYIYPSSKANNRKRKIDYALPFATLYMATTAGSKAPPQTMFKILGEFEEYGEMSKESAKIARNMEVFGMDLVAAVRKSIEKSPSDEFKELMWGIITTFSAGGDIKSYLHERARGFMQDYRRRLVEFSERLSTMMEIYLTLIIVGSIFFVVLTSIMSAFGLGGNVIQTVVILQFLTVFLVLPAISIGMIYFIKRISPVAR